MLSVLKTNVIYFFKRYIGYLQALGINMLFWYLMERLACLMQNQKGIGAYYVYHNIISYRYVVCVCPSFMGLLPTSKIASSQLVSWKQYTDSADVFYLFWLWYYLSFFDKIILHAFVLCRIRGVQLWQLLWLLGFLPQRSAQPLHFMMDTGTQNIFHW